MLKSLLAKSLQLSIKCDRKRTSSVLTIPADSESSPSRHSNGNVFPAVTFLRRNDNRKYVCVRRIWTAWHQVFSHHSSKLKPLVQNSIAFTFIDQSIASVLKLEQQNHVSLIS